MDIPAFPFCGLEVSTAPRYLKQLDNLTVIGEHLKKHRLRLRLLQADVAKILGVCEDSITGWENGRSKPQINHYPKIIQFLGYNPFPIDETTLGGRIKKYRIEHGLSHKKMGQILGVDASTICSWEDSKTFPNLNKNRKLKELIYY